MSRETVGGLDAVLLETEGRAASTVGAVAITLWSKPLLESRVRKPAGTAYQELVATMAKAFDPTANVRAGEWIEGPDGRLDMDVSIRGSLDGKPTLVVIECKDFDLNKTGKVGRPFIDALDSKRHDLEADAAFICSNSGFTEDALNKARRKGIGAISVLAEDDSRVKVVIETEIYFRRVRRSFWLP
jgi:hypothetical protein